MSVFVHRFVSHSLIFCPVCKSLVSAGCLDDICSLWIYASIFSLWRQNSRKTFSKCASFCHDEFMILCRKKDVLQLLFKKLPLLVSISFILHWPCLHWFPSPSLSLYCCPCLFFIVTSCPTRMCVIVTWPGWVSGWRRPGWSVETLAVRSQPSWRRSPSRMWLPLTSHVMVSPSICLLLR